MSLMNTISKVMVNISDHSAPNTTCGYFFATTNTLLKHCEVRLKSTQNTVNSIPREKKNHYDTYIQIIVPSTFQFTTQNVSPI